MRASKEVASEDVGLYICSVLEYLRIRGLAIAHDVQISFGEGLNVLSGETGAGKSIVIDALSLLRGSRGRTCQVREGSEALQVEGQFRLTAPQRAGAARAMEGDEEWLSTEEELIVSRTIHANGRGRSRVQNRLVPQSALRAVGEQLLDICGQHEQHGLIRGEQHRRILDEFAGLVDEMRAYEVAYDEWRAASKLLGGLRASSGDAARREAYLRFQIDEIEGLELEEGEHESLQSRLSLLRNVAGWRELAQEVQHEVYERQGAVVEVLGVLSARSAEGAVAAASLGAMAEHLAAARISCEEAASEATSLLGRLDFEPGALEQIEARAEQIEDVARKHGCVPAELSARMEEMLAELDAVRGVDRQMEEEIEREDANWRRCCAGALTLRHGRRRASQELERRMVTELAAVQMTAARVQVRVVPSVEDARLELEMGGSFDGPREWLDASGADRVEFLFSANEGEAPAPLAKVASGGELSRLLLAFKTVLAGGTSVGTSVFDEVDAGVSGAAAEAVGVRLFRASVGRQVICVTHLPQIAALADQHFRLEKVVEGGRTVSRVHLLSCDERIEELARMVGGSEVTKSARAHARSLLSEAVRRRDVPLTPCEQEGEEDVREVKRRASARKPTAGDDAGAKSAKKRAGRAPARARRRNSAGSKTTNTGLAEAGVSGGA